LRDRERGTLKLYYHAYDHSRVPDEGFSEPTSSGYWTEKIKSGIELTDRPPRRTGYEAALTVELPEDLVLPHEWPHESDWFWRVFRVPATLLNRTLGYGAATQRDGHA
jgi:hypothetical protein